MNTRARHILVPLDGSLVAEQVLPHAAALAHVTQSTLILAQVITPARSPFAWSDPLFLPATACVQMDQDIRTAALAYIASIAQQFEHTNLAVTTVVLTGMDVATTLMAYVAQTPTIAFIAMATHGQTGLRHLLMGSVAESVLHTTPVPLLLVHASLEPGPALASVTYDKVIVPLDGSAFAEQALVQAQRIATATDAEVVLLGVGPTITDPGLAEGGIEPFWMLAERDAINQQLAAYLEMQAENLSTAGYAARPVLAHGVPAEQIVQANVDEPDSLIVMTTHGRTGFQRHWLGSVAHHTIQMTTRPILLVRAQEYDRVHPVRQLLRRTTAQAVELV